MGDSRPQVSGPPSVWVTRAGALLCLSVVATCLAASDVRGRGPLPREEVGAWTAPAIDVDALRAEDELSRRDGRSPWRVGIPLKTDLAPGKAGTWEDRPGGGWLWRLPLRSEGALWIVLGFDEYRLQPGASLRVFDGAGRVKAGPFTSDDVRPHGELWLPPIAGEAVVLELEWPPERGNERPAIHLGTVSHGYRPWSGIGSADPLGAGDCHIDVNCPPGDDWQNAKRGVVRLLIGGSAFCTGSLLSNTNLDCKPYVLTAEHCYDGGGSPASTTFDFGYELPSCEPGTVPLDRTITGSILRASNAATDHRLLELSSAPPPEWNVFFNGWSRSAAPATASATIHHPMGDLKKITIDEDPLVDGIDQGPDHWRVTQWEQGSTDPGSSGGPLFDQNQRVVGELHVDTASCDNLDGYAEFGKFNVAWNTGGFGPFLDPLSTGTIVLDGMDQSFCGAPAPRLVHAGETIDDALGSNDGRADPGETFTLALQLLNEGPVTATGVSGTLSSSHPLVTVSDASATWNDVAPYQTVTSDAPHFTVSIDADFTCGESIAFVLTLSSTQGNWQDGFLLGTGTPAGLQSPPPFDDDMESGANGWTTQVLSGSNFWSQVTTESNSPTHSWYVPDVTGIHDSVLVMPTIADLPPQATLSFAHLMNSDSGDGGVLEYSTDGFDWVDAGELIVTGSYNSVIPTSFSSPLGGRQAWAGDLGGWRTVELGLSRLEGGPVTLRWRFASDTLSGGVGWYVDDVLLDAPVFECLACADLDDDGYCPTPTGDDCDDGNADVYPGAAQICDGVNNDCNDPAWPALPDNELDVDSDGPSACSGDCNGADPSVHPGADELCDGTDNDCDGLVDNDAACDLSCDAAETVDPETLVTDHPSTSTQPAVVWNGDGFAVVWTDARDGNLELYFSRLDRFGQVVVSERRLTNATADALEPSVVWTGAEYAVSWCDERNGPPEVYFVRLDASGDVLGDEVVLGSCFTNTSLTWNGSGYGMAWIDSAKEIRFALLDPDGLQAGEAVVLSDGSGTARAPFLAWSGTEYGVVWHGSDGVGQTQIFFTRVSATGGEIGSEVTVTTTGTPSRRPSVVWDGSGYGVTYNEGTGSARHIMLARLDAAGSVVFGPTQVTDAQTGGPATPWVAWTGGEYGLVWRDVRHGAGEVYFARVGAAGGEIGSEMRLTDNPAESVAEAAVWTGTQFGVVWSETPVVRFMRLGCNCFDDDGDGLTSCNDNCGLVFNPGQSDADSDFEGDHCDVDDGQIYIGMVLKSQVDWQEEQGFDTWNFYKGDLEVLLDSQVYTQQPGSNALAARQCGLGAPMAADAGAPASGKAAFYLVSGVHGGVESGLGEDSDGAPRPNDNPCP